MSKQKNHRLIEQWYTLSLWHIILFPISLILWAIVAIRQWAYRNQWFISVSLPVPVIIVGNINIGGSGKTPFVIWLCNELKKMGYKPAVISRGYGGQYLSDAHQKAVYVSSESNPKWVGDEPVLIAQRTKCPVWVGKNRVYTAQQLLAHHLECDILISDDGLQHYHLERDIEIALIDGHRQFGNQLLLPAGSLREPIHRLKSVDALIINTTNQSQAKIKQFVHELDQQTNHKINFAMTLSNMHFSALQQPDNIKQPIDLKEKSYIAFAGIGFPQRFFKQLQLSQIYLENQLEYDDHYQYSQVDIESLQKLNYDLITTEKDAIKLRQLEIKSQPLIWISHVDAEVNQGFSPFLTQYLNELKHKKKEFNYLWTLNY